MTILYHAYCPHSGYDQVFRRGRCLSCNTRPVDVGPEIHLRRQRKRKAKTELSGAGNEGGGNIPLQFSAGQMKLF